MGTLSRAAIALDNGSVLRLDQQTVVQLLGSSVEQRTALTLAQGAAYVLSRKPRLLDVNTAYANASIEGTEFLLRVLADRTVLDVFEGRVVAANDWGRTVVVGGQSVEAAAGQAPRQLIDVRPRNAVHWALSYPPILFAAGRGSPTGGGASALAAEAFELAGHGDLVKAFEFFESIPEHERGAQFHIFYAAVLLSVGRRDEARAVIDQALSADPTSGLALALGAVIALVENNGSQALTDASRAVELAPRSVAAKIALSYAQQGEFELEAARATLAQAVKDEPENALAWARLAEIWLALGDVERALAAAEHGRQLQHDLERVQTVLGFTALAAFQTSHAQDAFERAIALDSSSPLAWLGLGLAEIRTGRLAQGRADLEYSVSLDPTNALLRSYLGKAYFEETRDALAADQLSVAGQIDPRDPTPYFYSAILKQSENRPVEALRDLNTSIRLNDNRAVYRSQEMLHQDLAARGTSLARIYDDLGFGQLGVNEAVHSLSLDPANAAAHRFLADSYRPLRRRESARVSELLQSQLLQEINLNPAQPSLSETNLNLATRGGPAKPGLNEFNPLFERNEVRLNASAEIGTHQTRGDEITISAVHDMISASVGQFRYETDGFRDNNDYEHEIYDVFAQAALSPSLNVQAELLSRRSQEGDLRFNFSPNSFAPDATRDLDQDTVRLGARVSPSPHSDVLGSFIFTQREENVPYTALENRGMQAEIEYLRRTSAVNTVAGLGSYRIDQQLEMSFPFELPFENPIPHSEILQHTAFGYAYFALPDGLLWTVGLGIDDYAAENLHLLELNPKLGLQWDIDDHLRLRLAAFRTTRPSLAANRTIQPTQVAGFNQLRDDPDGTVGWTFGAALDAQITDTLFAGLEVSGRRMREPVFLLDEGRYIREDRDERLVRSYLDWTPFPEWAVAAEMQFDTYDTGPGAVLDLPTHVETLSLPLSVRWFSPIGLFTGLTTTFVYQEVSRMGTVAEEGRDSFAIVDLAVGYRFPDRRGLVSLEVRNLLDSAFRYQDDSFREFTNDPSVGPYIPERSLIGHLTVNF